MKNTIHFLLQELRSMLPATVFFFFVFHMIVITENVILQDHNMTITGSAVATIAALIVAKAILLVEAMPFSHWFSSRLWHTVLWKTLLFGTFAVVLRLLEELIPVLFGDENLTTALSAKMAEVSWPHFWLLQMWLITSLLVYCIASELVRELGSDRLKALFFEERKAEKG